MSHPAQVRFIDKVSTEYPLNFQNANVLEIGSWNVNGTVKKFFINCDYLGIDVAEGNGVDRAVEGQNFDDPSNSYDTVISTECFEHNPYWKETFFNMIRLCKHDGLIIMTCASSGRAEHGTTRTSPCDSVLTVRLGWEYYKNLTENDFRGLDLNFDEVFSSYTFSKCEESHDLYFVGVKR